jgi:hypothetical protein
MEGGSTGFHKRGNSRPERPGIRLVKNETNTYFVTVPDIP